MSLDNNFENSNDNQPMDPEATTEAGASSEETVGDLITALQGEIATLKDQWVRAVADTENLRKRAEREREDALKYGATSFARDMLNIADNLERALSIFPPVEERGEHLIGLAEGVELVHREMLNIFERHGIVKIHPMHERFDAHYHQAMFEIPTNDFAPGTVVEVMQPGYLIHGRLLRPAMVGVAKSVG